MKTKKFKGPLATPIRVNFRYPTLLSIQSNEEIEKHNKDEMLNALLESLKKLPLLFEHYGIDLTLENGESNYPLLCIAIAREFIPGFQLKDQAKTRGRKKKWNSFKYTLLLADIETIKRERKCGDRQACKIYLQRKKNQMARPQSKSLKPDWSKPDKQTKILFLP